MGEAFDISLLRNMRRLEELYLYVPGIRSRLDSVAECCPKLEVLECHGCGVTDEVIENLHRLTSIRRIELSSNPITDESSGVLSKSEGVEILLLANTKITRSGFERLTKAMPSTEIWGDGNE